ncbi:MAG TPA: nucleotidyltransferase domain-containing protein [Candidatus Brocadiia bacterium]|nr:nucleotidyltransferase domain-containing protein [Candidatus Brocadiia bacterium]
MRVLRKDVALEIATEASEALLHIYGTRLKGVYLYGSYARDDGDADSDVDLAVVLDRVDDRLAERDRVSDLQCDLTLKYGPPVIIVPVAEDDIADGRMLFHRNIKKEGILV